MNLGNREAAARRDAQLRGAEAFMAGELDDAHLLAEHRAACDEIKRLREQTKAQPAWLVLNAMADAITDARWMPYSPDEGATIEEWAAAKEADFHATRDDCCTALLAMEKAGWLSVDWDAEEPDVTMLRAEDVIRP